MLRRPHAPDGGAADRRGGGDADPRAVASTCTPPTTRRPAGFQFREQYPLVRALGIADRAGRRRHVRADDPPDGDHHLRRRVRVVDGAGPRPGVLRAPPHARDRRVRRLRVARPLRVLPLLRDRRAADVPPHRHLGLDGRGPPPGHLRLGVPRDGRRHQGIRGDEADPLSPVRVGVHPGRALRPLLRRAACSSFSLLALSEATFAPATQRWVFLAALRGLRHPGGHLAAPHLVARRARLRPHRGLDAPRGRAHEARRLRRRARGDDAPPRGDAVLGAPRGDGGGRSTSCTAPSRRWPRRTSSTSSPTRRSPTWGSSCWAPPP